MATTVVKVMAAIVVTLGNAATITVALYEFATITVIDTAAWALATELTSSTALGQSPATWSTTHAGTATAGATAPMGNGRTAAAAAHTATVGATTSAATTPATPASTAAALLGHKSDAVTGRVGGERRGRSLRGSPYE
jgi:hypothetical protein